jgi:Domain of unknown function (DUF1839)
VKLSLLSLDAASYQSHALHRGERAWLETNCYVDLWIEVLHAHGLDPHAGLGFTVAADFEGDQWLFFKQPTHDLALLYGVDVQELNIWRSLAEHVTMQLSRGRLVLVEVDAFHLPDTAGVSYRSVHTKTTIGIESFDAQQRTLCYFHNAGYFALAGEDFDALFGPPSRADALVPYTEFARIERERALSGEALVEAARSLLRKHIARMPAHDPIAAFRERFEVDLAWLSEQPQATFHVYAFSTLRQLGACYELAGSHLRWLGERGHGSDTPALTAAADAFDALGSEAKTLQFKAARAVVLKKPVAFAPMFEVMHKAFAAARETLCSWASG